MSFIALGCPACRAYYAMAVKFLRHNTSTEQRKDAVLDAIIMMGRVQRAHMMEEHFPHDMILAGMEALE